MPVQQIDVRDGDPTVQQNQQHRGTITATFDDGRILEKSIRATNADAWNDAVAAASAYLQSRMEEADAHAAVDPATPVTANKEASQAQTCIAYIRQAMEQELAHDAYLLLDRINTFVTDNAGWATVKPILLAEGLEEEIYDQAEASYNYLSGGGRPAQMAQAKLIQEQWESQ